MTNLRFLRWLVRQPVVLDGDARIDTLDRIWPPDDWAERAAIPDEAWATPPPRCWPGAEPADPWAGGWRLNARRARSALEADGVARSVAVASGRRAAAIDARSASATSSIVDVAGRSVAFRLAPPPDVDGAARAAIAQHAAGAIGPADVVAPMPGAVLARPRRGRRGASTPATRSSRSRR